MAADSKVEIELELRKEKAEQMLRQFEEKAAAQLERLNLVKAKYEKTPTAFVQNQLRVSQNAYDKRLDDVRKAKQDVLEIEQKIKADNVEKFRKEQEAKPVYLSLELQIEEAEKKLSAYRTNAEKQLKKLQQVRERYEATPNAFVYQQLLASQNAYARRLGEINKAERVKDTLMKMDGADVKQKGKIFGEESARIIEGSLTAVLTSYWLNKGLGLFYQKQMSVEGGNYDVSVKESTTEGGISGALAGGGLGAILGLGGAKLGAAVGTAIAPAVGTAIGAGVGILVGAVSGALLGKSSKETEWEKDVEREKLQRNVAFLEREEESGYGMKQESFQRMLRYKMRPQRMKELQKRIEEITSGEGEFSIKNLTNYLEQLEAENKIDTTDYKRKKAYLERSMREKTGLEQQLFQEAMKPMYRAVDPSSITDQFAKQGLYSGRVSAGAEGEMPIAGIDFKEINSPVVKELERIRKVLEDTASDASKSVKSQAVYGAVRETSSVFGL